MLRLGNSVISRFYSLILSMTTSPSMSSLPSLHGALTGLLVTFPGPRTGGQMEAQFDSCVLLCIFSSLDHSRSFQQQQNVLKSQKRKKEKKKEEKLASLFSYESPQSRDLGQGTFAPSQSRTRLGPSSVRLGPGATTKLPS